MLRYRALTNESYVFSEDTSWAKGKNSTLEMIRMDRGHEICGGPTRSSTEIMDKLDLKALTLLKKLDVAALTVSRWLRVIGVQ